MNFRIPEPPKGMFSEAEMVQIRTGRQFNEMIGETAPVFRTREEDAAHKAAELAYAAQRAYADEMADILFAV